MNINANFDSGNIEVISIASASDIQLKIRPDSNATYSQWFHFRLSGAKHQTCQLKIMNADTTTYIEGWSDYQACASYDRHIWFRVPTHFDGKVLSISHTPEYDSVYYAYFAPYSYEQHQNLITWAQQQPGCQLEDLGKTLDHHPISLLTIGNPQTAHQKLWIIARQHAGETMAEWFIEGFLQGLLDPHDPVAKQLLAISVFYIVPNMNIDGAIRGNLRANAAGTDLNRAWQNPSLAISPEVYLVRQKMQETGVDFFLDVHGDEGLPYNFVAGAESNPSFTDRLRQLQANFVEHLLRLSPDFQNKHGYGLRQFGDETLKMATNYVADQFDCLALTLEMPFKDNANSPDSTYGWCPARAKKLAYGCLDAIYAVLKQLR